MSGRHVPHALWEESEPLFPVHEESSEGGRKPIDNRTVFTLLVFRAKMSRAVGVRRDRPSPNDEAQVQIACGLIAYKHLTRNRLCSHALCFRSAASAAKNARAADGRSVLGKP